MSNRSLYDGANLHLLPFQHGPVRPFYDTETRSKLYTVTVRQRADAPIIQPIGSLGPRGGWIVDISQPSHLGCGVLEWDYTYAYLPAPRQSG